MSKHKRKMIAAAITMICAVTLIVINITKKSGVDIGELILYFVLFIIGAHNLYLTKRNERKLKEKNKE